MRILRSTVRSLAIGTLVTLTAGPVLSDTGERTLGPGRERFEAHLASFDFDREAVVQIDLHDGGSMRGHMCGTPDPTAEFLAETRQNLATVSEIRGALPSKAALSARIPLVFHVIQKPNGQGFVPDEAINGQVEALNASFRKLGVEFYVQAVNDVVKRGWFKKCLPFKKNESLNRKYFKMTRKLAVDPATTVNIYTCQPHGDFLGVGILAGWLPEDDWANAIVLHYLTLPGGPSALYSHGITGVHEMGHYLGLYHTFHPGLPDEPNGCEAPGDEVGDTPYEAEPAFFCEPRDTCPQAGMDPITNFMDYTDDVCRKKFTRGQRRRMEDMTMLYRPSLVGAM